MQQFQWPRGQFDMKPDILLPTPENPGYLALMIFGGIFGLDRLYFGDTGGAILKLLSFGVLPGFWWLWDVIQLFDPETMNSGLRLPFDFGRSGVGQGRFVTKSPWVSAKDPITLGALMLLPFGLDAWYSNNMNLFIRRLVECLAVLFFLNIAYSWFYGSWFYAILSPIPFLIGCIVLFMLVIPPWAADIKAVAGQFKEGVKYTTDGVIGYNSFYTAYPEMSYKDIPADDVAKLFTKVHPNEESTTPAQSGTIEQAQQFYIDTAGVMWQVATFPLAAGVEAVATAVNPARPLIKVQTETARKIAEIQGKAQIAAAMAAAQASDGLVNIETMQKLPQRGGGGLSAESMVMGATIAALIAGGALKGVIDYTVHQ